MTVGQDDVPEMEAGDVKDAGDISDATDAKGVTDGTDAGDTHDIKGSAGTKDA